MRSKCVVLGVVYPAAKDFLEDYFNSLCSQSSTEFDVLLANDGMAGLEQWISFKELDVDVIQVDGSISQNRLDLIREAIGRGYTRIIFSDTDDCLAPNRVEVSVELLQTHSMVVNDLDLMDYEGKVGDSRYFSSRFSEGSSINLGTITAGNLMGLSNTAATAEVLKNCLELDQANTDVFDWYLWSILLQNREAIFTQQTSTHYRVYGENLAGLPQPINRPGVERGIDVKLKHYTLLSKRMPQMQELAIDFENLQNRVNDDVFFESYIESLQQTRLECPLWWENIKLPAEVGLA